MRASTFPPTPSVASCDNMNDYPAKCVRQDSAKWASKAFVHEMLNPVPTGNWVGVNSFGNLNRDDHRLLNPQTDEALVDSKINNLVPGTNAKGFGQSFVEAINSLRDTQATRDDDKLRAVIVLKDSGGGNLENSQYPTDTDVINAAKATNAPDLDLYRVLL